MSARNLRDGIAHATLITPDLPATCAAYVDQLGLRIIESGTLDATTADRLDLSDLRGRPLAWLANDAGEAILRVIEDLAAVPGEPMFRHGWLSLEVLVADVDALVSGLRPPFRVLGPPADLELSPAIRASQVLGPCGELLYLTSIKAPVPPFDLPMTDARVAHTFIGVMTTPDRAASQTAWSVLAGQPGWAFDTKITVLNRAFDRALEGRYPVAVVPLPGQCMVEIDEVERTSDNSAPPAPGTTSRHAGQHSLAIRLPASVAPSDLESAGWRILANDGRDGSRHLSLRGPAGEHIELHSA